MIWLRLKGWERTMRKTKGGGNLKRMDRQDLIVLIRTLSEEGEQLREEIARLNSDNERLRENCETLRNEGGQLHEASMRCGNVLDCTNLHPRELEREMKALRKSVEALNESVGAAVVLLKTLSDADYGRKMEADA